VVSPILQKLKYVATRAFLWKNVPQSLYAQLQYPSITPPPKKDVRGIHANEDKLLLPSLKAKNVTSHVKNQLDELLRRLSMPLEKLVRNLHQTFTYMNKQKAVATESILINFLVTFCYSRKSSLEAAFDLWQNGWHKQSKGHKL